MTIRLYRNARIITMDKELGDFDDGDLLIDGSTITEVGTKLPAPRDAEIIDASDLIIIPGLVDTHRHMWQGILRGIAPHHTFDRYMAHILGDLGPGLSADDLYTSELLSARAALQAGVTTIQDVSNIQDSPEISDALVSALQRSGIRAVFGYGKSFPAIMAEGPRLPDDVRRVRTELLSDPHGSVTMALVAEGGSDDVELANVALAHDLDVPISRHFSSRQDLGHLHKIGAILPGTTFIHGNGLSASELSIIAATGGNLSVSPGIEMIMGHGYPMIATALAQPGLPVSLSVDVEVTVAADMFTQLRAGYQAGRYGSDDLEITVRDVLRMATIDGARSLGLEDRTGSLTPGKQADAVFLRTDRPDVLPVHDVYSTVVLQMDRSHIDTVMAAGREHVHAGVAVEDSFRLLADSEEIARRIRSTRG